MFNRNRLMFENNVCGMVYSQLFDAGLKGVENGKQGLITALFSDLDAPDNVDEWIEMDDISDYLRIDCAQLKFVVKSAQSNNNSIITSTIFSDDIAEKLKSGVKVLFLENYCLCSEEIRKELLFLMRYSKISDNTDATFDELILGQKDGNCKVPEIPLVIVHINVAKVDSLSIIDEFEKMVLCLE